MREARLAPRARVHQEVDVAKLRVLQVSTENPWRQEIFEKPPPSVVGLNQAIIMPGRRLQAAVIYDGGQIVAIVIGKRQLELGLHGVTPNRTCTVAPMPARVYDQHVGLRENAGLRTMLRLFLAARALHSFVRIEHRTTQKYNSATVQTREHSSSSGAGKCSTQLVP